MVIEASRKFLIDSGNAIPISELMEKTEVLESKEEILSYFKENYLLSDLKVKFERYKSMVYEISKNQGKTVEMILSGDPIIVNTFQYSPFINIMIHLFRNMVDHGIEEEEKRKEKLKPIKGVISVIFKEDGKSIFVKLSDDGCGIDPRIIKEKALKKGIKEKKELELLSEKRLVDLIFLPGFSTKEEVTNISGRGVGMDAVREEVERLGGTIQVESVLDKGTTFKIELRILK